jgi:hypothetical protein
VKAAFAKLGFEPGGGSADVLARKMTAEIEKWRPLVRERHIFVTQ